MAFEANLTCPKCGARFRVGIRERRRPAPRDLFRVVCPANASRLQFHVASPGPGTPRGLIAEGLREVPRIEPGTVVAEPADP